MSLRTATFLLVLASTTAVPAADTVWQGFTSNPRPPAAAQGSERSAIFSLAGPQQAVRDEGSALLPQKLDEVRPVAPAQMQSAPGGLAAVDESALRYYASQDDAARVAAEIRRLKVLHPSWNPPQDLFDGERDPTQEQALWSLLGEGRLQDVRSAVQNIQATKPNWRPSADLVVKFEQAEARRALIEASKANAHAQVLAIVEERPSLLACTEMDILWRVAEALVRTGASQKAVELYRFVLTRCPDPKERFATVQKASALLTPAATEQLVALGTQGGERLNPYEPVRLDMQRRRIGEAIANSSQDVTAEEMRSFEALAEQQHSLNDAVLVGWYRYSRKDWPAAARWFKLAMSAGDQPKAIEGYALSLRQQGELAEAEKIAYDARKTDPLIEKLYIEILATELTKGKVSPIEAGRLSRYGAVVEDAKSVVGSQALGWYHYNAGSPREAESWFARSVAFEPTEANTLGLALSANKLKRTVQFRALIKEYGKRFPAVAALSRFETVVTARAGKPATRMAAVQTQQRRSGGGMTGGVETGKQAEEAVALYKSGQYAAALATLDRRAARAREDEGLGLIRGWSLYHMGEYAKAKEHFTALDARRSSSSTQYGIYYTNQNLYGCSAMKSCE